MRTSIAVILAVLAGLFAPLAVVANWAQTQVENTDAFVAGYAPLARDGAVQGVVAQELTTAITAQLPGGENVVVRRLVSRQVAEFTAGETFAAAWEAALRLSHTEFRALLTGEPGRLQVIDGEVQIRFAPFADAVTSRLVGAGVPLIDRLPTVTGGLTVLRVDPRLLPALQAGYRVLSTLAGWLPLLALSASIAALWVWPRKRPAMIGVGLALAVGAIAVWLVVSVVVSSVVAGLAEPLAVVGPAVAHAALSPMQSPALAVIVTGAVLMFLGAVTAPRSEPATRPGS